MFKRFWLLLSSLLILAGCTSIDTTSNKDATYKKKLERIVISDNLSSNPFFGQKWGPAVQALSNSLTHRGLAVKTIVPRMEYQSEKGKDLKEAMAAFTPAQVMELNPDKYEMGSNYTRYTLHVAIYDAGNMKAAVWKSTVVLTKSTVLSVDTEKFANELIEKLEADGLLLPASTAAN